jgi:hypothetical protein
MVHLPLGHPFWINSGWQRFNDRPKARQILAKLRETQFQHVSNCFTSDDQDRAKVRIARHFNAGDRLEMWINDTKVRPLGVPQSPRMCWAHENAGSKGRLAERSRVGLRQPAQVWYLGAAQEDWPKHKGQKVNWLMVSTFQLYIIYIYITYMYIYICYILYIYDCIIWYYIYIYFEYVLVSTCDDPNQWKLRGWNCWSAINQILVGSCMFPYVPPLPTLISEPYHAPSLMFVR